jgi:peptidoglycan/LPS O-acetylase OafA/YrhL
MDTLATALDPSRNSLNALRLFLAAAVVVSHAWVLGGYGPEPAVYGLKLGGSGVLGFFAVSGYLITISAQRSGSLRNYVLARLTRIYPALLVSALVVGLVAAPLGALITHGRYDAGGALLFVEFALALFIGLIGVPQIGTSLLGNNDSADWNGPLWTLTWEVLCYVVVAFVVFALRSIGRGRRSGTVTVALFIIATGCLALKNWNGGFGPDPREFALPLTATFLAGSVLAHYRNFVVIRTAPVVFATAAMWAAMATGLANTLAPLPFAYLILWLGSFRTLSGVGSRYDISYGVYIYGWPIQQLLAALHLPAVLPPLGYAAIALVVVWPLAFLSCVLVEQPAQRIRRSWAQRRSVLVQDGGRIW